MCAALFGRDLKRMKVNDHRADYVDEVGARWRDLDGSNDLPVLRQFIYRFSETRVRSELTRVRSELAERRRTLPRPSLFLTHDSARLKVPSYREGRAANSDVTRSLGSGRIEKILKSIIVETISEKLCSFPRLRLAWEAESKDTNRRSGSSLAGDVVRTPVSEVLDSRSSSSDDGAPTHTQDVDGTRRSTGRKTRPKRGHYRKYNRQLLLDAVRAVQKGDMSVHRAGSYYGVPHSTLEYKVKERHLLRQRKTESSTAAAAPTRSPRSGIADDQSRHPRPSPHRATGEVDPGPPRVKLELSETAQLTRLRTSSSQWPYCLNDASTDNSIPAWQRLFQPDLSTTSSAALRLPPPPPLLPFDLAPTLPVGFGWPPPPLLTGMFPLRCDSSSPAVDSCRLPMLTSRPHPFSMSASDLLKSFQRKAAASVGGNDVREMADDRLMSLFPLLTGSQYGVASHTEDAGSPSQVAVG